MQSNIFRKIPTLVDVLDLGSGLAQQLLKRYLALIFAMGLVYIEVVTY
jgi:hypothetical protein